MKAMLRSVNAKGIIYPTLMFVCPGCAEHHTGLHSLPVNTDKKSPAWIWNENLEAPTLTPSILTKSDYADGPKVCHSFLTDGVFNFLTDSTHSLAGKEVPIPDLPDWLFEDSAT